MKKLILFFFILPLFFLVSDINSQSSNVENDMYLRAYHNPSSPPFISQWDKLSPSIKNKNAFKRYEWFYKPRLNEFGIFPKEFIDIQRATEYSKIQNTSDNLGNVLYLWSNVGPRGINLAGSFVSSWGVCSGRIRGLAIHPTDPNIAYIGAASGGIWKTTDGGTTWNDMSGTLNLLTFGAIAIDQSNPNIIYAGTGEVRWGLDDHTYEGDGMYKSTDAGDTWIKIASEIGTITHFADLTVSPHNSSLLFAAIGTGNSNLPTPTNQGIWRSSNSGLNWTRVIDISGAFDVACHPTNPNIIFASTGNKQANGGFLISTNAGLNFSQSNDGLPPVSSIGRIQFDISNSNPQVIYCLIYDDNIISGGQKTCAYKSINGGLNWSQISSGVNIAGSYDGTTVDDQGDYDLCIAVNPINPDNVLLGNVEISKTINGSTITFLRQPGGTGAWNGYTHVDVHNIKFAPSNPSVVYVGCDGGIYKSTNGGQSFAHFNYGINTIQFYRIASHPTNPNKIFGGAQDNGAFETSDRGITPWNFKMSGDGMECFYDYSNSNIIFSSTQNGSLSKSTNGGLNWYDIRNSNKDSNAWCTPYWQHPANPDVIFGAALFRIVKSTDKGENWNSISDVITNEMIHSAVQSKPNSNNMMLITNSSSKVYKSSDEGVTWTDITGSSGLFAGASLMRVQADPVNANTFYIMRGSYTTGQVLKTSDFGASWVDISSNLPKVTASDIYIDTSNTDIMFLGNDFGVYRTTNAGASWEKLTNGFPFVPVIDFNLFSYNGVRFLRAATYGRGVYEININEPISVREQKQIVNPEDFTLYQNYPNPFNSTTNIKFQVRNPEFVKLSVFDMLGKEVAVLLNGYKPAGTYEIRFDANNISSGIYYYQLKSGDFTVTKKLVLIK